MRAYVNRDKLGFVMSQLIVDRVICREVEIRQDSGIEIELLWASTDSLVRYCGCHLSV